MGGKIKCDFKRAFVHQRSNARTRGIGFKLVFDEWKQIWIGSGRWDQRGRGADKYCMCRIGDLGDYEVGNVFIGLGRENTRDGNLGRVPSVETRAKISASNTGKPHPWSEGANNPMHRQEVKKKISEAMSGLKHHNAKGVNTPSGFFESTREASLHTGVPMPTIQWRCRHNKFGFSYGLAYA